MGSIAVRYFCDTCVLLCHVLMCTGVGVSLFSKRTIGAYQHFQQTVAFEIPRQEYIAIAIVRPCKCSNHLLHQQQWPA